MKDKHRCSEKVLHGPWSRALPCSRNGVVEENGMWWCKQHAPSVKKSRDDKWKAKYDKECEIRRLQHLLNVCQSELVEVVVRERPPEFADEIDRLLEVTASLEAIQIEDVSKE